MIISGPDGPIGAGVAYIRGVEIVGGDNGFAFKGVLRQKEGGVRGTMNVVRFIKGATPILPVPDPNFFELDIEGGYSPERFWIGVYYAKRPELGSVSIELRRYDHLMP